MTWWSITLGMTHCWGNILLDFDATRSDVALVRAYKGLVQYGLTSIPGFPGIRISKVKVSTRSGHGSLVEVANLADRLSSFHLQFYLP